MSIDDELPLDEELDEELYEELDEELQRRWPEHAETIRQAVEALVDALRPMAEIKDADGFRQEYRGAIAWAGRYLLNDSMEVFLDDYLGDDER